MSGATQNNLIGDPEDLIASTIYLRKTVPTKYADCEAQTTKFQIDKFLNSESEPLAHDVDIKCNMPDQETLKNIREQSQNESNSEDIIKKLDTAIGRLEELVAIGKVRKLKTKSKSYDSS